MNQQEFDNIIANLEKKYNGDDEHDIQVVREFMATLERSTDNVDLIMKLGRYSSEKFPNAAAVKDAKQIEEKFNEFHDKLDKAQKLLKERKFEEALEIFNELIGQNEPPESKEKRYYSFSHPFEEMLCRANSREDQRPIERISPLPEMLYFEKGSALFDLKRYDEAKQAYELSLKLNPVNVRTWFELAQIAKINKDTDEFKRILKTVHPFLFTRPQLAQFYREQAYLASMEEKYQLAATLIYLSLDYDDAAPARATLNSLAKHKEVSLAKPTVQQVEKALNDAKIPIGPAPDVYGLAIHIGQSMKKVSPEVAKMAFAIAYDITHYQPLLKELQ